MGEWALEPLDNLVEEILDRRGVTPLKLGSDFVSDGYRVISAKLVKGGRVDLAADEARFVDATTYRKWMRSPLLPDDVILTSEAPLGEGAYVAERLEWCLGQRLFGIRTDKSKLHGRFLHYALQSEDVHFDLLSRASGSVAQGIRQTELRKVLIPVPPLPEQRAIAHILGTLDDKIELNRRMNETLEAMARALFKSWFVDFDPVRAKMEGRWRRGESLPGLPARLYDLFPDRLVDSELGEIPEGWEVASVGAHLANYDSRRVPVSGAERLERQGPYPYHGAAGVMDYVDDYLFDGVYLLIGEDGSVVQESGMAVTQYVWGKFWVNNHAHVVQGLGPVSTEQLYLHYQFAPVAPYVTGAVQPKLSQGRMNTMPFLFATDHVCREFSAAVAPLFARLRACSDEGAVLEALRDALLPKLISGELRVELAERVLEPWAP